MHFCSECSNMYYIRIDAEDSNQLVYYCRKCGNEDKLLAIQNVCVSKTQIKQTDHSYDHIINKYKNLTPPCRELIRLCVLIRCAQQMPTRQLQEKLYR